MISDLGGCTAEMLLYLVKFLSTDQTKAATDGRFVIPGPKSDQSDG
jgi:hypothetical protein